MKEKLKNSLVNLNIALEELSQNISNHDALLSQQYNNKINKYRNELSDTLSTTQKQDIEIKRLNDSITVQKDKLARAETKLKDLIISLKNKIEQL